ncbi:uncharacterized protein TrAtP1_002011 [Trichoderma atroviride]|uniref:uncharacterized protein n=1 Tax=Hypocrea atroviridis TaxID=63577 RepID=UPI003329CB09|nr:hypothetical protein TrAtP1_002011 [Trichoderma atroviride]
MPESCQLVQSTKYINHLCWQLASINLDAPAHLIFSCTFSLTCTLFFFFPFSSFNLSLFFFFSFSFTVSLSIDSFSCIASIVASSTPPSIHLASHIWALHLVGLEIKEEGKKSYVSYQLDRGSSGS